MKLLDSESQVGGNIQAQEYRHKKAQNKAYVRHGLLMFISMDPLSTEQTVYMTCLQDICPPEPMSLNVILQDRICYAYIHVMMY